jgi:hypothetical protein
MGQKHQHISYAHQVRTTLATVLGEEFPRTSCQFFEFYFIFEIPFSFTHSLRGSYPRAHLSLPPGPDTHRLRLQVRH